MPELPDVELYKHRLDETALHRTIAVVTVSDARILRDLPAAKFAEAVEGRRFEGSLRHGKHLLAKLDKGGWVTLHFGMTGDLVPCGEKSDEPPYTRVRFDFADGGALAYTNRRMLGHVGLTDDAETFLRGEGLGPDALDPAFDRAAFAQALGSGRRSLKSALMDQAAMAGVGNIFADEILFQARLHPETKVAQLTDKQTETLFRQTKAVLETAIACGAGSEQFQGQLPQGFIIPQRKKDGRCPRCGTAIGTLKAGGRTAYFCPNCQKPKA